MKASPDNIESLLPNQVFVFGSNTVGRHGKGAAKQALTWGAKPGQGEGLMGQTYGIPTKDFRIQTLPLPLIALRVERFISFASKHKELEFLVTEVGCGLAGYKPKEIAPLFEKAKNLENVLLPKRFLARYL